MFHYFLSSRATNINKREKTYKNMEKHTKRIDTLPIQKLEEKLFKGYKVNKKSSLSLPHYKEGDIVFDTEDTLNAYNNDIVILDVYKHTYKIMYVEDDSKKVVTKVLPKSAIAYKYLVN